MRRYVDLDRFLEESAPEDRPEVITVQLFEREWKLPPTAPARVIIRAQRLRRAGVELLQRALNAQEAMDKGEEVRTDDLSEEEIEYFREALSINWQKELSDLVGAGTASLWVELCDDFKKLQSLYWRIIQMYESSDPLEVREDDEDDEDETVDPEQAGAPLGPSPSKTSSNGGPSSKQTSSGSTD